MPKFSLMAFASAIEPLRAANRLAGREIYVWHLFSPDGKPVAASNGIEIVPEARIDDATELPTVAVCAGLDVETFEDRGLFSWLRRMARHGAVLGGICTGSYILARLGLLDSYRCTIHWENLSGFRERFPELKVTANLFEIDRDRFTCAGGIASIDMMLHLIALDHGRDLSAAVSEQFMHPHIRTGKDHQRMNLQERLGVNHPKLVAAISEMEANIELPIRRDQLARKIGLSVRQLERLFRVYLATTLRQHYLEIRLEHARQLLGHSAMSVLEVALASGFVSASHFSRAYRLQYGHTPRAERSVSRVH